MMRMFRFTISRIAAEAIQIENLPWVAVRSSVRDRRFSYALTANDCDIVCSREMAACLIEGLIVFAHDETRPIETAHICAVAAARVSAVLSRAVDAAQG